jgi:hypothetical protein
MQILNVKYSTVISAAAAGLVFALLYTDLENLTENREANNLISAWHTPLIWFLTSEESYWPCVRY